MRSVRLLALGCIFSLFSFSVQAEDPPYIKTEDGIIIYTDARFTGTSKAVKLEVVSDNIIRVIAAPEREIIPSESLVTVYARNPDLKWQVDESEDQVTIKTKTLIAKVNLKTGSVQFSDLSGKPILSEKQADGRSFKPVVFDGQRSYNIIQNFESSPADAFYGLGQHQDDLFNYNGQQVHLFQNNTEVAIPFVISNKNYGILWDNYSLTTVGDIRPFHPLTAFKLYSKNGEHGWLTASYSNDKNKPSDIAFERAECEISMEFLGQSRQILPKEFKPAKGVVNWEGSIASDLSGTHHLRFTYGGYIKLWLDGKLVLDRWRKAWNPAPALVPVNMKQNEKIAIRIEWIPEGEESYLSLKWQEPTEQLNSFGFASEAGRQVDYYFIYGKNMDEVIGGYRTLTGKAPIVPKWALGFWQSRERYKTQDEILSTVAEFRKRRIPLDNIVLDWSYWKEDAWGSQEFDETRFPSPDSMIDVLHDQYNTRFMISVWPKFYEGIAAYKEFDKNGWLYKRNIADRQRDWIGKGYVSTFYDAFNEKARKGFWDLINEKIYSKGVDAWWMDASEPDILSNVSPQKRKQQMTPTALGPAAEYLNAYPLQNAKGIYEGQRSTDPDKRVFLLTRSGWAGSQRYAATIWSGDIGATWHDMKAQIPAGINFSMSGLPYWTMDIGGFVVERRFEQPDATATEEWRELLTRWHQFGAFVPVFRSHGQYPFREIYNTAPETHTAYKSMVYYNKLRYRLMPYLYSLAGSAYHDDYTIMRALVMDFASDKQVLNIGDQFMLGPSLLVNPVYEYRQRNRELYLPAGQGWYDLYSGKYHEGGQTINADAPYERMPVYVKQGSIIPFGPELQYTDEKPTDTIALYIYTGKDASFKLYEDNGTSYDYEKGKFSVIPISYDHDLKIVRIGERQGAYDGMLKKRVFRIIQISPSSSKQLNINLNEGKKIIYTGKSLNIKLK